MARGPKQRKLRKRRRTGEENRPDPALLDTNNERHLAAAEMARRSFEDQPRGPDGRWVEGKLVTLPEPRGDLSGSTTTNLSWAIEGTGVVGEVDPVTLMQPFVHPHDRRTETLVEVEVTEFVVKVTPEQQPEVLPSGVRVTPGDPRPRFYIDEYRKNKLREGTFNAAFWLVISLFFIAMFGIVLYEIYKRY